LNLVTLKAKSNGKVVKKEEKKKDSSADKKTSDKDKKKKMPSKVTKSNTAKKAVNGKKAMPINKK